MEQHTYLQNMKPLHNIHDMDEFLYNLEVLGKMIQMTEEQMLQYYKDTFLPKNETQLL